MELFPKIGEYLRETAKEKAKWLLQSKYEIIDIMEKTLIFGNRSYTHLAGERTRRKTVINPSLPPDIHSVRKENEQNKQVHMEEFDYLRGEVEFISSLVHKSLNKLKNMPTPIQFPKKPEQLRKMASFGATTT